MADDASPVSIELQYKEVNPQAVDQAKVKLKGLEEVNESSAKSFNKFGESAEGASSKLAGLNNELHSSTASFTRAERNILHVTAILFALKETYEAVTVGIEAFRAKLEEKDSFDRAEKQFQGLTQTIRNVINELQKSGTITGARNVELRDRLGEILGIGDENERQKAIRELANEIQAISAKGLVPPDLQKAQIKLQQKVLESQEPSLVEGGTAQLQALRENFAEREALIKQLNKLEVDAVGDAKDAETKKAILAVQLQEQLLENTNAQTAASKKQNQIEIEGAVKKHEIEQKLNATQLETTNKQLTYTEDQIKQDFENRLITQEEYHDKVNDLISRQELVEIASLDNTVDQQEKADQIRIESAKKRLDQEKFIATVVAQQQEEDVKRTEVAAQKKRQIQKDLGDSTTSILGSAAEAAKLFGREGFIAYKAFAIAQATIAGVLAVLNQLGSGDPYSAPFRAAAAAAAAAVQIATIVATQPPSYEEGGLIPGAPSRKDNRIAYVATGEYILDAPSVARVGAARVAAMHQAMKSGSFDFFGGGLSPSPRSSASFAGGGLVGSGADAFSFRPTNNLAVGFLNTRQQEVDFLRTRGTKVIIDQLNRRAQQVVV